MNNDLKSLKKVIRTTEREAAKQRSRRVKEAFFCGQPGGMYADLTPDFSRQLQGGDLVCTAVERPAALRRLISKGATSVFARNLGGLCQVERLIAS